MTKEEVAAILDEIATLMEVKGENPFKCNAYRNGGRAVQNLSGDIEEIVREGKLVGKMGIGESLRNAITTLVTTGSLPFYEELKASVPAGVVQMLRLPGMGPKKVKTLHDSGITTLDQLKSACEAGTVAKMKGFGAKTQQKILEGLAFVGEVGNRVRIDEALPVGEALVTAVRAMPGVIRAELAGSLRRRRETAKDIDIVASSANPGPILEAFTKLDGVRSVTGKGDTKCSVVVQQFVDNYRVVLNADLRVVDDKHYPVALLYFTGNKDFNIKLRRRAIARGWSLNEYDLGDGTTSVPVKDEADIFAALELDYVPPEMREDTGEVELATRTDGKPTGKIPKLVEASDIRGVFHNHTKYSDGANTLEEMALAAKSLGFEYLGIADHSQSLTIANGLSPQRVELQHGEIDELNKKLKGIRLLKGCEVDILADGRLDYRDEVLAHFEYVVASVHTLFNQPEEVMTERICRAIRHPLVTMLGHATGRLLLRREGYKVNLDKVLDAAAETGKMIEINAQPMRLDLDWVYCKRAKALGIPLVINPDAHSLPELELYRYGVNVARRAWLEAGDVFNTRGLKDVLATLKK
jgi:DNA polymerase (family 10)